MFATMRAASWKSMATPRRPHPTARPRSRCCARGTRIDVLFTDIVMPGRDGIEVARQAIEQMPGLTMLFASGYAAGSGPLSRLLKTPDRSRQLAGEIAAARGDQGVRARLPESPVAGPLPALRGRGCS
jgi:CheY-like chemotaxis protein